MILGRFFKEFKMAKKRTKKDKARAKKNRKTHVKTAEIKPEIKLKKIKKEGLMLDSSYVIQDLKKTLVVTLIVLIVLGIIALLYT